MICPLRRCLLMLLATVLVYHGSRPALGEESGAAIAGHYAEILVVDSETGRGVPLVELETVNGLDFVTDNAGRVAFYEPGLMDREIYLHVRSHGYQIDKDGFGNAGVRITPRAGQVSTIKIKRNNVAERLCRITGEGLYRDSVILGYDIPLPDPLNPGHVGGQDSVQTAIYQGRVYWMWGDTDRMNYPLGLFRMAGATTPLPNSQESPFDPAVGIPLDYFVDDTGFARAMMPLPDRPEGVIWIESLCVVPDESGRERLVGHYSRRRGLGGELEQGIALFNDDKQIFESAKEIPLEEKWRRPKGQPIMISVNGVDSLLFGGASPNVRV
jgi:hypothetical protein